MGSLRGYICKNCGLNDLQCPGHVGHIELSYPVFNPMFFHICERLMNIKCFNCHHLRISSKNKKIFLKQIRLTMKGDIYQFFSTNDRIINRNNMDNHLSKRKKNIYQKKDYSTNSEKLMIRANLFKNLFKQKFHNICPYCYLGNPKFKNENYLELIQEKCSKKIQTYNTLNNIKLKDLLTGNIIYDIQHAIFPFSVENHLKALWSCEENLLTILFNNTDTTWKLFFKETILVSGNRFRPPIIIHHIGIIEHQQNKILKQILKANNILRKTINDLRKSRSTPIQMFLKKSLKNIYIQLQYSVNLYIDSSKSGKKNEFGIRQLLEKKEGLFRMNMMGKRVNYTARTVINPDPSLKTCEVGVPLFIALELTYDEPVNSYNYEKLKRAVINGPFKHPGANSIFESGKYISLSKKTETERKNLANRLLTISSLEPKIEKVEQSFIKHNYSQKKVQRHLENNDIVLMNRQPSLHRASILAHRVHIQHSSKVLRFHYANCNSYNADFDGDEMNLHFPQNELARSEAYSLMNTDNQFCIPKDGSPIRGIFQDHIVGAIFLTKRDTFLLKTEIFQLIYNGLTDINPKKIIYVGLPTILKPYHLYSGKQLITFLLINLIGKEKIGITMNKKCQTPSNIWNNINIKCEEDHLILRQNYFCTGVLDKALLGDGKRYNLVHSLASLYGFLIAESFLTSSTRIFNCFLQKIWGFSSRIEDFEIQYKAELKRKQTLTLSCKKNVQFMLEKLRINYYHKWNQKELKMCIIKNHINLEQIDREIIRFCGDLSTEIIKFSFPIGAKLPFPQNHFMLMILSGAKGTKVNMSQILSCLGQQSLEEDRIPRMLSGKTLPSFLAFNPNPRAGGFISNRFLTGLEPEEYYFHCMSGREGLVDTAVKTSRSGYLQRCLVKHLESEHISYDYTVRDSNLNVLQFVSGEDGLDPSKTAYLEKFKFLVDNINDVIEELPIIQKIKLNKIRRKQDLVMDENHNFFDPINNIIPVCYMGSISERFDSKIEIYIKNKKNYLKKHRITNNVFRKLCYYKYLQCINHPGESVGVIAAQSMGEPSTQMTLNTFHLAGHGKTNVTLGIPRMRELIITASKDIKTPTMTMNCIDSLNAKILKESLERKYLTDLILKHIIYGPYIKNIDDTPYRIYKVELTFLSFQNKNIVENEIRNCINTNFKRILTNLIFSSSFMENEKKIKNNNSETSRLINEIASVDCRKTRDKIESIINNIEKNKQNEIMQIKNRKKIFRKNFVSHKFNEKNYGDYLNKVIFYTTKGKKMNNKIFSKKSNDKSRILQTMTFGKNDLGELKAFFLIQIPNDFSHLKLKFLVNEAIQKVMIRNTPNIFSCYYSNIDKENNGTNKHKIITEGINIPDVLLLSDLFDMNSLETNSIFNVFETFGIEAGRASIIKEINYLLKNYGLDVSYRHIGLISDYMTQTGLIRGLNRSTMAQNNSPYQRITFESSTEFLVSACFTADQDNVQSPSSCIVHGSLISVGTNSCDVLFDLNETPKAYWNIF